MFAAKEVLKSEEIKLQISEEIARLRAANALLSDEHQEMSANLKGSTALYEREKEELKSSVMKLQMENAGLRAENAFLSRSERQEMCAVVSELKAKLEESTELYERERESIEEASKSREMKLGEENAQLRVANVSLSKGHQEMCAKVSELTAKLKESTALYEREKQSIAKLTQSYNELETQIATIIKTWYKIGGGPTKLAEEFFEETKKVNRLAAERDDKQQQCITLEQRLQEERAFTTRQYRALSAFECDVRNLKAAIYFQTWLLTQLEHAQLPASDLLQLTPTTILAVKSDYTQSAAQFTIERARYVIDQMITSQLDNYCISVQEYSDLNPCTMFFVGAAHEAGHKDTEANYQAFLGFKFIFKLDAMHYSCYLTNRGDCKSFRLETKENMCEIIDQSKKDINSVDRQEDMPPHAIALKTVTDSAQHIAASGERYLEDAASQAASFWRDRSQRVSDARLLQMQIVPHHKNSM